MSNISAELVKQLREATSVGMMDCKKALVATNGNYDEAVNLLRLKGLSRDLKEGRTTNQGVVAVGYGPSRAWGTIVELNCETDFVALNKDFIQLANIVADDELIYGGLKEDQIKLSSATFGENIVLRRLQRLDIDEPYSGGLDRLSSYVHSNNQIGVILHYKQESLDDDNSSLMRDIAMHIAATSPKYVTREEVDPVLVSKEEAFLVSQPDVTSKPESIRPKMIQGRMGKFYEKLCVLEQPFVKDPSTNVGNVLKCNGVTLTSFVRYEVGEA